jgi:hypothetical protein
VATAARVRVGSSSHGGSKRGGGGCDRGGRGHTNNHATGYTHGGYNTHHRIDEIRHPKKTTEVSDSDGFPAYFARLRDLVLLEKFKPLGITKYDVKQNPVQWLRCYALSIENASGNNNTKCIYFLFGLDQDPLTLLELLDKNSIDQWDQLKAQFTKNFAGAMGCSVTCMDLVMVK